MDPLNQALLDWRSRPIHPRHFVGHPAISASPSDYSTSGHVSDLHTLSEKILFDPYLTPYAILLHATHKGNIVDAAVVGFSISGGSADCVQIQGRQGGYRELSPLLWDRELLRSLVLVARESGLDAVTVLPARHIQGNDEKNIERLIKRYDSNAQSHGFRFSTEQHRYVLDLKQK